MEGAEDIPFEGGNFDHGEIEPASEAYGAGVTAEDAEDGPVDMSDEDQPGGPHGEDNPDPHAEITTNDRGEFLAFRQPFDGAQPEVSQAEIDAVAGEFAGYVGDVLEDNNVPTSLTLGALGPEGFARCEQRALRVATQIDGRDVEVSLRTMEVGYSRAEVSVQELVGGEPDGEATFYTLTAASEVVRTDVHPPSEAEQELARIDGAVQDANLRSAIEAALAGEVLPEIVPTPDPGAAHETELALGLNTQPIGPTELADLRSLIDRVLAKKHAEDAARGGGYDLTNMHGPDGEPSPEVHDTGDTITTNDGETFLGFREPFDGTQQEVSAEEQGTVAENLLSYVQAVMSTYGTHFRSVYDPVTNNHVTGREHTAVSNIDGRKVIVELEIANFERPYASIQITDFDDNTQGDAARWSIDVDGTARRSDTPRHAPLAEDIDGILGIPDGEIVDRFVGRFRDEEATQATERGLGFNNMPFGMAEFRTLRTVLNLVLAKGREYGPGRRA